MLHECSCLVESGKTAGEDFGGSRWCLQKGKFRTYFFPIFLFKDTFT
jgi:hypothetical protein